MPSDSLPIQLPHIDYLAIAPEVILMVTGLILVLIVALNHAHRDLRWAYLGVGMAGVGSALLFVARQWSVVIDRGPYQALSGMVAVDGYTVFLKVVVLIATALGMLLASSYLHREGGRRGGEYHVLLLLSASGMLAMTSANDLIVVFLSLEILSIALYVLVAFDQRRAESQEAGIKYFVLGAFSSAFFLYGVALVYGATGTTSLSGIAGFLARTTLLDDGLLLAGFALLLVGLGFKVAAVPFHMWTPDVYQGAPTPVTGFMAAGAKAAGFAALIRIFVMAFGAYRADWQPVIWVLAVLSLFVGSVVAIVQSDIKRMLAYSSISHAGYVLIGMQAASTRGVAAALFYLLAYTMLALGTFAIVNVVGRRGDTRHSLDEYRGLGARHPMLAAVLTLFLLGQAGVPLTSGFIAKLGVFAAAAEAKEYSLAIIGVLAAVVAAFFYLRVIVLMYLSDEEMSRQTPLHVDAPTKTLLAFAAAATLILGVFPSVFLDFARHATLLF